MLPTLPRLTDWRLEHPEKTLLPMDVTDVGKVTPVMVLLFAKTLPSTWVTPDGMEILPPSPEYDMTLVPSSFRTKPSLVVWSACELPEEITHTLSIMDRVIMIQPTNVLRFIIESAP